MKLRTGLVCIGMVGLAVATVLSQQACSEFFPAQNNPASLQSTNSESEISPANAQPQLATLASNLKDKLDLSSKPAPKNPEPGKIFKAPKVSKDGVIIDKIPHITQKPDFCGEACVAMYLRYLGYSTTQDQVFNVSELSPAKGRGCYAPDLYKALKNMNFKLDDPNKIWFKTSGKRHRLKIKVSHFDKQIFKNLRKGYPSICCMYYDNKPNTTEHFRLIVGYDPNTKLVYYHEPAHKDKAYQSMPRSRFLRTWGLKGENDSITMIAFTLKPSKFKLPKFPPVRFKKLYKNGKFVKARISNFTKADYAQKVLSIKEKPPVKGLRYLVRPPFVIVGNESKAVVYQRTKNTVSWAADNYRKQYFKYNPDNIIVIWLMKDKKTYLTACKKLMNYNPGTPYGFFSSSDNLLMMNISTGGGTLVHEMFHAYIPANFPEIPSWCNEGFASLYEQCGQRDGKIIGYTNWRLAGLQRAIKKKRTVPLKKLMSTTTNQFYADETGEYYAMARYLCYYLQEKGKLQKFYDEFYANQASDPTGIKSLCKVLGIKESELPAFQKKWEKWCLKLRFP